MWRPAPASRGNQASWPSMCGSPSSPVSLAGGWPARTRSSQVVGVQSGARVWLAVAAGGAHGSDERDLVWYSGPEEPHIHRYDRADVILRSEHAADVRVGDHGPVVGRLR